MGIAFRSKAEKDVIPLHKLFITHAQTMIHFLLNTLLCFRFPYRYSLTKLSSCVCNAVDHAAMPAGQITAENHTAADMTTRLLLILFL